MLDCPVRFCLICLSLFLLGSVPARAQTDASGLLNHFEEAREYCVVLINELRMESGLASVQLEPLACELGQQHARDMASRDYFSHWDMQGRKPTRRYNELGGMHGLGENIFYSEYQQGDWQEFIDKAMQTLSESPGHRQTMLDPSYTHVGIGMAVEGERFYLAQEFICRVGGEYRCRLDARVGDVIEFSGRINKQRYQLNYVLLRHEPLPEERDARWLSKSGIYSEGDTMFAAYTPQLDRTFDVDTYYDISVDELGRFETRLLLDYKDKPGTYYVMLILHDTRTGSEVRAASIAVEVLR